jgi:AraC-like DNA-binding protein
LTDAMGLGVRTWGNDPAGRVVLLTGTYLTDGEISRPLLDALPAAVVVRRDEWDTPLVGLLADEIARDRPGDQAVLDRLLDLLLIAALRQWASRPGSQPPGWYRAQSDPIVGPALRLLHDDPAAEWTVARLAAAVGISRAACARRFTELVGVPPMTYLARWRLALAADLLREQGATVGQVAARVGYTSPFTFSTAFKRHYGVSPRRHRERQPA